MAGVGAAPAPEAGAGDPAAVTAAGAGGAGRAGLVDVVLLVVFVVVVVPDLDLLVEAEDLLEVLVVGVVTTEEVFPEVAVVLGGATTVPLLKLTAPKALLTDANGDEVEGDVTALDTVDEVVEVGTAVKAA